jgi:hypothetical protein
MPSDYRKHCERLGASLAYARGLYEAEGKVWRSGAPMRLDLALWGETQNGDLDNLAKTVMDAAQLHRGEEPGAVRRPALVVEATAALHEPGAQVPARHRDASPAVAHAEPRGPAVVVVLRAARLHE